MKTLPIHLPSRSRSHWGQFFILAAGLLFSAPLAHAATRTGFIAAVSGAPVPGLPGVTYTDFFQVQVNFHGECAFVARASDGRNLLMTNSALGSKAAPASPLAAPYILLKEGDDPRGAGGKIASFPLIRLRTAQGLQSPDMVSLVRRARGVAYFGGTTQDLVEEGSAPDLTGQTVKTITAALGEGTVALAVACADSSTPQKHPPLRSDVYSGQSRMRPPINSAGEDFDRTFIAVSGLGKSKLALLTTAKSSKGVALGDKTNSAQGVGDTPAPTGAGGRAAADKSSYILSGFPSSNEIANRSQPPSSTTVIAGTVVAGGTCFYANVSGTLGLYKSSADGAGRIVVNPGDAFASQTLLGSNAFFGKTMMDDAGAIYFIARLGNGKNALFRSRRTANNAASDDKVLLIEGAAAPGLAGATIQAIQNFAVDASGRAIILASFVMGTSSARQVLYDSVTGTDSPQVKVTTGDDIQGPGGLRTITALDLHVTWNKNISIGGIPVNASGRVAARVTLAPLMSTTAPLKTIAPAATAVVVFYTPPAA